MGDRLEFLKVLSERMMEKPEPKVLVMDHGLSRLAGLPLGSVQPALLVERRLGYFGAKS